MMHNLRSTKLQSGIPSERLWVPFVFVLLQVVEFIWITVDPQTCIPNPAMTGLAQHLVGQIIALRPRFSVALRKAIAGGVAAAGVAICHHQPSL
jgi:hypothetical protein